METQEKKYLRYTGYAIGAGALLWLLFRNTESGGSADDPTGNGGSNSNPAVPAFNANSKALKLYDLMKEMGSDEKKIVKEFVGVSQSQFKQISDAFGKKSYNKTLGNQYNFFPLTPLPLEPLQVWLETELSDTEYNTLALKYPNYL